MVKDTADEKPAKTSPVSAKALHPGHFVPSGARIVSPHRLCDYVWLDRPPRFGDVLFGRVTSIGYPFELEDFEGHPYPLAEGTETLFIAGNRYSPDNLEGLAREAMATEMDLLAESGVVGTVRSMNAAHPNRTRVEILGYVVDEKGRVLNTFDNAPTPQAPDRSRPRAKLILNVGTSMNSGKTTTAVACCRALAGAGDEIRATKLTGVAGPRDTRRMLAAGAIEIADFLDLGWPSTYLIDEPDVIGIFDHFDATHGSNPDAYWVVEISDGILQRETAILLRSDVVRSRIHRLVFSVSDALGAIGGLAVLRDQFGLVPDALSGRLTGSPLMIRELRAHTDIPVFDNRADDLAALRRVLV